MRLEVKNGSFSYHRNAAVLKDISFSAEPGEILSILGPNGVGKTTLLKCMLGFLKWNSGEVLIDGQRRNSIKSSDFWQRAAYVPQARTQTFTYSCEETVLMGRGPYLSLFEQPKQKDIEIAERSMEMAGVTHLASKNCNEISGGELQLVLIARALAAEPELLIMDEPETGLDFRNQLIVLNLIRRLSRENGLTILLNTHYPEHAIDISDKALILNRDGHSCFGRAAEVITEENLRKAFEVDVRIKSVEVDGESYRSVLPISLIGHKETSCRDQAV